MFYVIHVLLQSVTAIVNISAVILIHVISKPTYFLVRFLC